eukprot:Opistho-2@91849
MYFALKSNPSLGVLKRNGVVVTTASGQLNAGTSTKLVPVNFTLMYESLSATSCGDDSFSYIVTDGTVDSSVITVRVTVACAVVKSSNSLNLVPIIVPIALSFAILIIVFLAVSAHMSLKRKRDVQRLQRRVIDFKELKVMETLAEGSFGVVRKAEFRGTEVAIKMLKAQAGISNSETLKEAPVEDRAVAEQMAAGRIGQAITATVANKKRDETI